MYTKKLAPELSRIEPPRIELPFLQKINPYSEQAWTATIKWVEQFKLVPEQYLPKFRSLDYHWLSGFAFPTANLEQLLICDKCMTLFNLFDQFWDDAKPEQIAAGQAMLMGALRGQESSGGQGPLEAALRDMRSGMLKYSTPEWMDQFIGSVEDYFRACVWEAQNKKDRSIPTVRDYIDYRERTGAVQPSVELAGVLGLVDIPPRLMKDPTSAQLNKLTNHVITMFNDLISLKKEMLDGDVHNLVLILKNEEEKKVGSCSLEQAVRLTVDMHDEEVRKFVELSATIHSSWKDPIDPELKPERVEPYIDVLRCWMRSNMDWSSFSERYHPRLFAS